MKIETGNYEILYSGTVILINSSSLIIINNLYVNKLC
jgi:hypothetical protein